MKKLIKQANKNLRNMFGNKHVDINIKDIEKAYNRNCLSIEADSKTTKGSKNGSLTGILYLAPSNISGIENCPFKSKGCAAACLNCAGRGKFYNVQKARVIKTLAYHIDKKRYTENIKKSIKKLIKKAEKRNMVPIVRLNGTSDINFINIINQFPAIQFYDYTKNVKLYDKKLPKNYDLTFSLSESNDLDAEKVLHKGGKVAVVFKGILPNYYKGFKVVDGDVSDERFKDNKLKKGLIIGLKAKGRAKYDKSGFVR